MRAGDAPELPVTDVLRPLAREAGTLIQHLRSRAIAGQQRKADQTIVTEADRASERYLVDKLRVAYPTAAFVCEEGTREAVRAVERAPRVFVIDPLDGTGSFVADIVYWAVSIGSVVKHQPSAGVVYLPDLDQLYYTDGDQAYFNDSPARVAAGRPIDPTTIGMFPSSLSRLLKLKAYPGRIRSLGCASVHVAMVASGQAQFGIVKANIWDIAAAMAVLRVAGGVMRYASGRPIDLRELYDGRMMPEYGVFAADEATWKAVQKMMGY